LLPFFCSGKTIPDLFYIPVFSLPEQYRHLLLCVLWYTKKEKDNIMPMELKPMKALAIIFLVCLMLAGTASAKLAPEAVTTATAPKITAAVLISGGASCSDEGVWVPTTMGELYVTGHPSGASFSIDGSQWTPKVCTTKGYPPVPLCILNVDTGSHSVKITHEGYKDYSGTFQICSQKVTYLDVTMSTVPPVPTTTMVTATAIGTTIVSATGTATTPDTGSVTSPAVTSTPGGAMGTAGTGSLSVTTTPAGATVYLDGVQRGISPTSIPGLAPGDHTLLLKLAGYEDLTAPVTITAGQTQAYTTALSPAATPLPALPAATRTPGFGAVPGIMATGALLFVRKIRSF
jgi:hypothetical protein